MLKGKSRTASRFLKGWCPGALYQHFQSKSFVLSLEVWNTLGVKIEALTLKPRISFDSFPLQFQINDMDTAENLPLQCDFRALHVRLVGALSLQYPFLPSLIFFLFFVNNLVLPSFH